MKAVILAAGYGTRLKEITEDKSKALLEIAGKPLLEHVIEKILKEIKEIYIVSNAKFFPQFKEWLNKFNHKNKKIILINDGTTSNETRLGGLDDLALVIRKIGLDDLLVLASDNLFEFNLGEIYEFFKEKNKDAIFLYDAQQTERAKLFGVIKIDKNNKIINFAEKPAEPDSTFVSTGIYFFTKASMKILKPYLEEGNPKDSPGNFVRWLIDKEDIYGFAANCKWYDIGNIESYEEAKKSW